MEPFYILKNKARRYCRSASILVIILSIILIGFTGCSKTPVTGTGNQSHLSTVQQNKFLTARLYGLMTFDYSGTTVSFPTELIIASVPINWMGQIFDGKLVSTGPGNDLTDQVHGSVSADGNWILTLSYSRQIIRTGGKSVSYRITLKNIPIFKTTNSVTTEPGKFEQEGDVQKFIETIEYTNGLYDGSKIVPEVTYVSTDWSNVTQGLQPILKLTFEEKASQIIGPMPPPQPGMGMGRS